MASTNGCPPPDDGAILPDREDELSLSDFDPNSIPFLTCPVTSDLSFPPVYPLSPIIVNAVDLQSADLSTPAPAADMPIDAGRAHVPPDRSVVPSPPASDTAPPGHLPVDLAGQSLPPKRVILVEPIADHRPVSKFFGNPLALSKALALTALGRAGIANMVINSRQQLLVLTLTPSSVSLTSLLQVDNIGSWAVRCRLPLHNTSSMGVIGPLGEDTTDDEVTAALHEGGFVDATAYRILRGRGGQKTSMFRVRFSSSKLPDAVIIGYQRFRVSVYVGNPWQCYRCQRFGHNASNCRSAPRCVACSGPHSVKDCTLGTNPTLCSNCGGAHTASYGGCPAYKEAKKVEHVRAHDKLSYRDATAAVRSRLAPPPSTVSAPATVPQRSWATVTSYSPAPRRTACSVGTQTSSASPAASTSLFDSSSVSAAQLVVLLCKVLSLNGQSSMDRVPEVVALTEQVLRTKISLQDVASATSALLPSSVPHAASMPSSLPLLVSSSSAAPESSPSPASLAPSATDSLLPVPSPLAGPSDALAEPPPSTPLISGSDLPLIASSKSPIIGNPPLKRHQLHSDRSPDPSASAVSKSCRKKKK